MDLTDEEFAELRQLHERGAAAPWFVDFERTEMTAIRSNWDKRICSVYSGPPTVQGRIDALLILTMRNALPRLLDELERRRKGER